MGGAAETRIKRLRLRAWRRGTREMDLLLGGYVDARGAALMDAPEEIAALEALISLEDPTLYAWIAGAAAPSAEHAPIIAAIRAHHQVG